MTAAAPAGWKIRVQRQLVQLEVRYPDSLVLTQNIDGFHGATGSQNLIDIHGDGYHLLCTKARCGHRQTLVDSAGMSIPPLCPACGCILRPDVVLFGEMLSTAKIYHLQAELDQGFDLIFSMGTSSVFPFIAEPVIQARRKGVMSVEINPGETEFSDLVSHRIRCGAAAALGQIWDML